MKALGFKQHGHIEVMQLFDAPIPKPGSGEVLIEVKVSAFNHLDIWVREGWPGLNLALPHIAGSDAAGIITEIGPEVKHLQMGQRVAINPGINLWDDEFTARGDQSESPGFRILGEHFPGTHAEYVVIPAKNCILLPDQIPFEMAAAVGLVGMTAWRMLMQRAQMHLGQRVLIIGAGGGVNSLAIQLAKLAGCEVFTVTSTEEKMQKAQALGADVILNYRSNTDWAKELLRLTEKQGFDIVVDNVGKATLTNSLKLAKRGGKIVIVGNTSGPITELDLRYIFSKQISLIGSTMGNHGDYLQVMNLLFQGKLTPVIDCKIPLEDGISAMQKLEQGEQFGKILLSRN